VHQRVNPSRIRSILEAFDWKQCVHVHENF
jgi:hypothetical protein